MMIPIVRTAIAPNNGMPAHPAPHAAYFKNGDSMVPNCTTYNFHSAYEKEFKFSESTNLIQLYTNADVKILTYTPIDENDEYVEGIFDASALLLNAGGYYSFSVIPASTLYFKAVSEPGDLTILEG